MTVCYNKLWKLLIDKNMKKKDLRLATGISTTALAKLGKNEHVSTEILTKICKALDCDFCDIIELVKEKKVPCTAVKGTRKNTLFLCQEICSCGSSDFHQARQN